MTQKQVIFGTQKELRGPDIALSSTAPDQLPIDAAGLMTFRSHDM